MDHKKLGDIILSSRKNVGLSQSALGQECGIHDSDICKLENGKMKFKNLDKLIRVAERLNIPLLALFYEIGIIAENPSPPEGDLKGIENLASSDLTYIQCLINGIISMRESLKNEGSKNF